MIVARNRELFRSARVLDIMSGYGFWSLAALDAGAAHVVGVETSPVAVAAAQSSFVEYGIDGGSYRFVNAELFAALDDFHPGEFDLVVCQGYFEQCDPRLFFHHLGRLRPRQVILDTGIIIGEGPITRFTLGMGQILGTPNHPMIMFLCDNFDFRWRLVDWRSVGITDWTGIHEYERDHRRTYILEAVA